MSLVLDVSYTVALALQEANIPGSVETMDRIAADGAHVPSLWRLEVGNVLLTATRRKRIDATLATAILHDLDALPITTDPHGPTHAWTKSLALANRHGLTLYDATYLELALRLRLPLASLDRALVAAARGGAIVVL